MSKYLRMQSTAARLIKENGGLFKFKTTTDDVTDEVNGTVTPGTEIEQNVDCVVLIPGGSIKLNSVEMMVGENLSKLSKINNLLISPKTPLWRLKPLDQIFYEEEWWILEFCSPLKPDGKTIILYKAFMRRP